MFFIDASMVGHIGAEASASIGLVESTTWLLGSITNAASLGFSVQAAHFIGSNDFAKARQVFRHALICTSIISFLVLLSAVAVHRQLPYWLGGGDDIAHDASLYFLIFSLAVPAFQLSNLCGAMLKCSGNMRIPSIVSVLMCVLDVVFNYIFIFVMGLGVVGAAVGTALAVAVGALVQAYFAIVRSKMLALRLDSDKFVAQIVSTMIVAPLGNFAIAANTFAITVESLCYMPGYGIGDAATTLVGQTKGAQRLDLCRSFAHMTVGLGMAVMAVMGAVMYIFAPEMMGILTPVEEIRILGTQSLRIEAFAEPMFAASIVVYCVCVGAGDTLKPVLINLFSMWCVRLSLAALLAPTYGLRGVWTAMALELTFRGILFLVRLFRGRWLHHNL